MKNWKLLLLSCLSLLAAQPVFGFAGGAGACIAEASAITGMGGRNRNDPGTGPYQLMFDMGSNTYSPGQVHVITIFSSNSSEFTGLLLYGETTMGDRVGAFDKTDPNVGSPVNSANCPGSIDAAASHTGQGPLGATEIMLTWTAPASDVGPITLRSIVLGGNRGESFAQEFYFPTPLVLQPGEELPIFENGFEAEVP